MVFWVFVAGAVLAVLGVLSLGTWHDVALSLNSGVMSYAFTPLALLLLAMFVYHCRPWRQRRWYILPLAFFGAMGLFGLQALWVSQNHREQMPKSPLKVTATVQIFELSDSPYDGAYQLNYRQKAVISDIKPFVGAASPAVQTIANPFYQPSRQQQLLSHQQPTDPSKSLTVLLTGKSDTPNLDGLQNLKVGQQATMTLLLSPITPTQTGTYGFDGYRFAMTRHLHANAQVLSLDEQSIAPIPPSSLNLATKFGLFLQQLRQDFRQAFLQKWHSLDHERQQAAAVTLSLLTGDRGLIDRQTKDLYQYAGISHLLAISGTHVLFLAIWVTHGLLWFINRYGVQAYYVAARWQWRFVAMVAVALLYALFTGFDVPAVRTVAMLLAAFIVRYLLLFWSSFRVLGATALVMVWLDPYVLWQAAFWLSFVAVAILLTYEQTMPTKPSVDGLLSAVRFHALSLLKLQTYVFIAMLPLSIWLFGKVSLLGLVVNLFAIGLFGYVIVPLNLLAGVLFLPLPFLSEQIWSGVSAILLYLARSFDVLSLMLPNVWLTLPMGGMVVVLGVTLLVLNRIQDGQGRWLVPRRLFVLPVVPLAIFLTASPNFGKDFSHRSSVVVHMLAVSPHLSLTQALVIKDDVAWLIIGGETDGRYALDVERLANDWQSVLQAYGVRRLSGAVVQHHDERLAKAIGQLSLSMPINHFWWAGQEAKRFGKLWTRSCQADKILHDDGFLLSAMTGWQAIADKSMHACSLSLTSDHDSVLHFDFADDDKHFDKTSFIFDATGKKDNHLWSVWQLLCDKNLPTSPVVLTSSRSQLDGDDLVMLKAHSVYFGNLVAPKEQTHAKQRQQRLNRAMSPAE